MITIDGKCGRCGKLLPDHTHIHAHYDESGELVGVVAANGRNQPVHSCGVKFKIPPRPKK